MKTGRNGMYIIIALVLAALLLAVLGPKLTKPDRPSTTQQSATSTSTSVSARGLVESVADVDLASQAKTTIVNIYAQEGEIVRKGQLLIEFDAAKPRASHAQAVAELTRAQARYREVRDGYRSEDIGMAQANRQRADAVYRQALDDYERQKRLLEKGAATRVEFNRAEERKNVAAEQLKEADQNARKFKAGSRVEEIERARSEVDRALAEVRLADAVLSDYRIIAPMTGLVTERLHEPGESVDVGTPVLKMIDHTRMRIRAELEESDIGKIMVGRVTEVTCDAYPGKVFKGKVSKVLPVVRKKTQKNFDPMVSFDINTQEIHVQLEDYKGLHDGMTVTVRFK
jgi:multidrug resistance efflux pump